MTRLTAARYVFDICARRLSCFVSQGQEYELEDLCVESAEFSGTTCTVESVLGKWEYDVSVLGADTSVLDTVRIKGA